MKPSFLERQMDKMSTMYDETLFAIHPLPEPDEFGQVRMSYKDLRQIMVFNA